MRIELPLPAWADSAPRADDDAHTLTMAPSTSPIEWAPWQWGSDPAPTVRMQVDAAPQVTVTVTF